MNTFTLVAMTKYLDIWQPFYANIAEFVSPSVRKIVVVDGTEVTREHTDGWERIQGPDEFQMARNYNLGWRAVGSTDDVLSMNDDATFLHTGDDEQLRTIAYSQKDVGIVSPTIVGGCGNLLQVHPRQDVPLTYTKTLATICVYMRRQVFDAIGFLDEGFTGSYSAEDADFCVRANHAGFRCAVSRDVKVQHGNKQRTSSLTSVRAIPDLGRQAMEGVEHFRKKHGHWNVTGQWDWSKCGT